MKTRITMCALALCTSLFYPVAGHATDHRLSSDEKQLLQTPLTEILKRQNLTVTSVSKKAERLSEAAAAIYVITNEDIRRSGATSIPEALRLAPGLQVARIDSNKFAISSRGFNAQLSNKLLVLIDGRDIYTPLFSGVNWDVQDYLLEDIDRIEVIRGPGATLWGANAVNGVINIITKSAKATPSTLVTGTYGTLDRSIGARQGGKFAENGYFRVYSKFFDVDETEDINGNDAGDGWRQGRVGFRADWEKSSSDDFTLQGDLYIGREDRRSVLPTLATPTFTTTVENEEERSGGNILGRWKHRFSDTSETSLQMYFDKVIRDNFTIEQDRTTVDVDFQHTWDFNARNELIWGAGYRYISDDFGNTDFISFTPDERDFNIFSTFAQNKYAVIPEELFFTVGSKFEHNDFTGFEFQPSARVAWLPAENQTVWAAVSRAVRTPSRAEDDFQLLFSAFPLPGGGGVGLIRQEGDRDFESEKLIAYELGYRIQPKREVAIDIAAFFNDYDELRTAEFGAFTIDGGLPIQPLFPDNLGEAQTYGVEVSVNWEVTDKWELLANYTFLEMDTEIDTGSTDSELAKDEGRSPQNQFSLRSQVDLPHNVEFDTALFYVDNLSAIDIDSYLRFDARLGWSPRQNVDISLVGQNLLDDFHPEFSAPVRGVASEIPRSVYGKVTVRF